MEERRCIPFRPSRSPCFHPSLIGPNRLSSNLLCCASCLLPPSSFLPRHPTSKDSSSPGVSDGETWFILLKTFAWVQFLNLLCNIVLIDTGGLLHNGLQRHCRSWDNIFKGIRTVKVPKQGANIDCALQWSEMWERKRVSYPVWPFVGSSFFITLSPTRWRKVQQK